MKWFVFFILAINLSCLYNQTSAQSFPNSVIPDMIQPSDIRSAPLPTLPKSEYPLADTLYQIETRDPIKELDFSKPPKVEKNNSASFNSHASSAPTTFDPESSNLKRYQNSPCFAALGFNPYESNYDREKRYKECEDSYYKKNIKNVLVPSLIILIILISGYVIYRYNYTSKVD